MAKNCGKCGKSFTVSKKFKPAKGEWTTYEQDQFLLKWEGVCQSCMDKEFPPVEKPNASSK